MDLENLRARIEEHDVITYEEILELIDRFGVAWDLLEVAWEKVDSLQEDLADLEAQLDGP